MDEVTRPRVFVDADVLFAGAAGPTAFGASLVILRMAEITLIEAVTSWQAVDEAARNLADKLPAALPAFRLLVSRCLVVTPTPTDAACQPFDALAHSKDLPILVAALREHCPVLLTFNDRHFQPGHPDIVVMRPGAYVQRIRSLLTRL